jgi:hypothetical protein
MAVSCVGCGGAVPDIDGPTHKYVVASPGCWWLFGDVTARQFDEYGGSAVHQLAVDAYMVQHPGNAAADRRQRQSVAVHLCSLYLQLVAGVPAGSVIGALARLAGRPDWPLLPEPASVGALTVADVAAANDRDEYATLVRRWAQSAWEAWSAQHATVRSWLDGAGEAVEKPRLS